ncbi:MAG: amidohydrolase, partial [bacterium]|nr:amidohydrolase [bacterium]
SDFSEQVGDVPVTGAVVVEASDRFDDNIWVLKKIEDEPRCLAFVGNIDPYRIDFTEQLQRLCEYSKFVGLRARNSDPIDYEDARVVANFRKLAKAGLSLDMLTNGGGFLGVQAIERVAAAIPDLTIIVDHILGYDVDGNPPSDEWLAAVDQLAAHANVVCKVSGLFERSQTQPAPHEIDVYRSAIEMLWERFGSERLIFGSNWPVLKKSGDYASVVQLLNAYFSEKGDDACQRYFWKNAIEAYRLNAPPS